MVVGGPGDVVYLTVADGTAYVSVSDGRLYAISHHRWRRTVARADTRRESRRRPRSTATPSTFRARSGDSTSPDGELYVIDRASGTVRWRFRTPSGNQITLGATADGALYAGTLDGSGLYALPAKAAASGAAPQPLWHTPTAAEAYKNQAMVGDLLYVPTKDPDEVVAVGVADGAIHWHLPLTGIPNGTLASGGMLFTTDDSGVISAYAEQSLKDAIGRPRRDPSTAVPR